MLKKLTIKQLLSYKIGKGKRKFIILKDVIFNKKRLYDNSTGLGFESFLPYTYLQNIFYHKEPNNHLLSPSFIPEIKYKVDAISDYFGFPYDLFYELSGEENIHKFYIKSFAVIRKHPIVDTGTLRFYYIEIYDFPGKGLIYKGGAPIEKVPRYLQKSYKELVEGRQSFHSFCSFKNRFVYFWKKIYYKLSEFLLKVVGLLDD